MMAEVQSTLKTLASASFKVVYHVCGLPLLHLIYIYIRTRVWDSLRFFEAVSHRQMQTQPALP
jgi:hypothetical protein